MRAQRILSSLLVVAVAATVAHADDDDAIPNSVPTVMDRRWAVALAYGGSTMRPRSAETQQLSFGTFRLAVRFRPIAVLEFGFELGGGGTSRYGSLGLYADVRYRLLPELAWNPFLLLGLGGASASNTLAKPAGDLRKSVRFGGGIERRFTAWAFATELHLFVVGDNPDVLDMPGKAEEHLADSTVLGGSLSIFAIYYWGLGTRTHRARQVP